MNTAIFAAGCFWGVQYHIDKQEGVISTCTGYIGGNRPNPSYSEVKTHKTGHVEAVKVEFDPAKISYEDLCKLFFEIHDPAQMDGQGPDIGHQYLSGIFYNSQEQLETAKSIIADLRKRGHEVNTFLAPVIDEVREDTPADQIFWPAEAYHQHYYENAGGVPYCHFRVKKF